MSSYYDLIEEECEMPCMTNEMRVSFRQSLSEKYFKKRKK